MHGNVLVVTSWFIRSIEAAAQCPSDDELVLGYITAASSVCLQPTQGGDGDKCPGVS